MFRSLVFAVAVLSSSNPAVSQSSLGLTGAELRFGYSDLEGASGFTDVAVDVAITEFHGLQGDIVLSDTISGTIRSLALHAYLTPTAGQKYGLFTYIGDVDGRSATYGGGGVEGLFALSPRTAIDGRAGLGLTHRSGFDFIFAEFGASHDFTPEFGATIGLQIAEFDEAAFSAMAYQGRVGISYRPDGQPFGVFADLTHDRLSGRDARPSQTSLRAGLSISLGNTRRGGPETRNFSTVEPLGALIRRDLF